MACCSSPKIVTRCNNSHLYADFRKPSQRNRNCTGKKIFEFLFFLVLVRFFLGFPAAQANSAHTRGKDENNFGSGDGLARKSRQFVKPRKSFFAAVRASDSERDKLIKALPTEFQNSDPQNSTTSGNNVFPTATDATTIEVNFTKIPVDLTATLSNKNSAQFTSIFPKSAGENTSQG